MTGDGAVVRIDWEDANLMAERLTAYEKLALQLTDACTRWGWGHCTAGPELIAQIDDVIARFKASEARTADLLKALEDIAFNDAYLPSVMWLPPAVDTIWKMRNAARRAFAAAKGETV